MEVKIFSSCIGASNFTAGKPWRSVCFDLVACGENILSVDAGNIRAGSVLAHDLVQPDCRNCRRQNQPQVYLYFFRHGYGNGGDDLCGSAVLFRPASMDGFYYAGSTFQQPAIQSVIPQLVPENQLIKTNGWMQLMNAGSFFLGPVIGASLYAAFPMSVVLMSDVAGAILASTALAIVKIPKLKRQQAQKETMMRQFKAGLNVFQEDKKLLYLVTGEALCMFFYAPLSSFYPLMTSDFFNLSAMYGSAVELAFAVGMIVSSLLFSSVWKVKKKIQTSFAGLLGMGMTAAVCGILPPVYTGWFIFAGMCVFLGASGNVHSIPLNAYIQETVAPEKMGRAFSVLTLISSITMPAGLLMSSPVAEAVGVNTWFFIAGLSMLVLTAVVLFCYKLKYPKRSEGK